MTLGRIVRELIDQKPWPGFDSSWFERELAAVGMSVDALGEGIHAIVVGVWPEEGAPTLLDFSVCPAPAGAHGVPNEPVGEERPCLTFFVLTTAERMFHRDQTSKAVTIGES